MSEPLAVLVNGLPGAGKTTLARTLARHLGLPLFSKDLIKETHAGVLGAEPPGWPQRRWNAALGAAASETMWTLLAEAPTGAVLESCWPTDVRDFVTQGLSRANHPRAVEIWCDVPLETARRRFEARHPRHPIHGRLLTDDEWERWRRTAQPLRVGPTLHVDTTRPVDQKTVIAWIRESDHRDPGDSPAGLTPITRSTDLDT
ncbi:AAA family ATPase [Streptomyces sporangiiformans]|uniref:ATP-binding protein n=1 Tax=Streptomyces sporangiiformans TaxID=2315329 RepID=A0A505DJS7_9ACTN|nr:AAA family ATPase [Streptomyces sporangiiformans]TPQ21368.1 ATP-binding protein [Streptomyces sporangiiformans]